MKQRTFHYQQGIALGPILFIIAILAIIAAAIAAGSGSFTANTNTEGSKVSASTIIQVAESLKSAVQKVQSQGCTATQISFANPTVTSYTNPNSPSDKSCNVFDPNGGSMSFPIITTATHEIESPSWEYFTFEGSSKFTGLGTGTAPSLAAFLPIDSMATCDAINAQLGLPTSPYTHWFWYQAPSNPSYGFFTGTYNYVNNTISVASGAVMGCAAAGNSGHAGNTPGGNPMPYYALYFFYVVLLVQ
jgi:type II secretory pathway pseudopilin PulG